VTTLRSAPDRAAVEQWALVLVAEGMDSRLERAPDGWRLVVDSRDADRGARLLEDYDRETRERASERPDESEYGPTRVGFAMAGSLLAFYVVTGSADAGGEWFRRGRADADLILGGEIWRTVTALTLHADFPHLLANVASCALFATALCRSVGPGVGAWLILLAGAFGNALNAWAYGSDHLSVGASTAIFGAIGLLGGLRLGQRRGLRLRGRGRRAWAPVAAGLALLALLGTGSDTDVSAHLFGFLSGAALGALAGSSLRQPPRQAAQWLLTLGALVAVATSWQVALR
jgi:rhomboid protease GluP